MKSSHATQRRVSLATGLALSVLAAPALAQSSSPYLSPYDETISITLGGIVNRFDTSVRFDNSNNQHGTDIHLEDNALAKNLTSFEATATWRFFRAHRLDLDYYTANRSGSQTYSREVDIGDNTYPLGATVNARANSEVFSADYRWSFSQQPTVEWAALLGLYGGTFKYDIDATGTVGGVTRSASKHVSTTVPLPMLGVSMDWYPDPQWHAGASIMGIKAKIGDVDGHAYRIGAYGEWMFLRNWGVGARYVYNDIEADVTKSDFNGNLGWRANSVSLYAKAVW
jgi:hypothetical protein